MLPVSTVTYLPGLYLTPPNWRCTCQGTYGRRAASPRALYDSLAGEPKRWAARAETDHEPYFMPRRRQFATAYSEDVRTTDIVLNTGPLDFPDDRLEFPKFTRRAARLADDLWIGRHAVREAVMDACELRGENSLQAIRQFPSHYGFYRTNAPHAANRYRFDSDNRLRTCLQLSRLIRPSSTGYCYAARIIRDRGRRREIVPFHWRGIGTYAYQLEEGANWFSDEDVAALRSLLTAFRPDALPHRVKRALWYHEYIFWTQMIDVRWPLCVTALEALVHTDDSDVSVRKRMGSTEQFVQRLSHLSQFVPGLTWTTESLRDIYDRRSGLVHGVGRGADAMTPGARRLYLCAEQGLRAILVGSIRKAVIAELFATKASIRTGLGF